MMRRYELNHFANLLWSSWAKFNIRTVRC